MSKIANTTYVFREGSIMIYLTINHLTRTYQIENNFNYKDFRFGGRDAEKHITIIDLLKKAIDFADIELAKLKDKE